MFEKFIILLAILLAGFAGCGRDSEMYPLAADQSVEARFMRAEKELLESLHRATSLIDDAANGRISVGEFVKRYGNFYYYEALDGHEADRQTRELLDKYRELVLLHEEVQTDIVDITYLGPKEDAEKFLAAGRILPAVAAQKLARLASRPEIARWLEQLRAGAE